MGSPTEPVNNRIRIFILDDHKVVRRMASGRADMTLPHG
jgi:hypothetical protein